MPLVLFVGLGLGLALLMLFYVLAPFGRARPPDLTTPDRARQDTLAILRERHHELTASLPADAPERGAALAELADQAGWELGAPAPTPPRPVARHRGLAAALALVVGLLGGGLYAVLGSPAALQADGGPSGAPQSLAELSQGLRQRVQGAPKDVAAWHLLGQAELAQGAPEAALAAFEQAYRLAPDNATLKVDLADALGQAQGARLDGRPIALIREALALEPQHPKALALAGAYALSQHDIPGALQHWRTLLTVLPAESPQAQQIAGFVADLEAGRGPRLPKATEDVNPAPPPASVQGTVRLAPALAARVPAGATLFIAVRTLSAQGAPQGLPVAVLRQAAPQGPTPFTLDDTHAMSPRTRLSALPATQALKLVARISASGQAQAQGGDLQGESAPFTLGNGPINVLIDTVVE